MAKPRPSNDQAMRNLGVSKIRSSALLLSAALTMSACNHVDIGGPSISKRNAQAGILQLPSGKQIGVLPDALNYTGEATFTWPDGRRASGFWQAGKLQGMGQESFAGGRYTGQWHEGQRHGHGELTFDNGTRYVGDFVDGLAEGKGTRSSSQGVYRGTWQKGKRHGQGQYNGVDETVYQGQWYQDQRSGYGQEEYANGDAYVGSWQADKPEGFGRFFFANGATYEGSWLAGQRQGYGVMNSPADVRYEGTWRADQRHGFGKESRPDGSYFAGNWRDDQRDGKGTEVYADGSAHRGLWQQGTITGLGSRTNRAGIIIEGDWHQDRVDSGTLTLPGGPKYEGPLFSADGRNVAPTLMQWMQTQAAAQQPYAQYFLGAAFIDFENKDLQTAKVWLHKAARANIAEAQFRLAVMLINEESSAALDWFKKAAEQDHPGANEQLGAFYHTGEHLPQNFPAAIDHYRRAANRGSVAATNNLAWLLATSKRPDIANPEEAISLIQPLVLYLGDWQHLDTLAAAHARLGDAQLAQRLQTQALAQARIHSTQEIIEEMTARLDLYKRGQPYTE